MASAIGQHGPPISAQGLLTEALGDTSDIREAIDALTETGRTDTKTDLLAKYREYLKEYHDFATREEEDAWRQEKTESLEKGDATIAKYSELEPTTVSEGLRGKNIPDELDGLRLRHAYTKIQSNLNSGTHKETLLPKY